MDTDNTPSALRRGADDGLIFGLYLSAMFLCAVYADHVPALGFLSMAMFFMAPMCLFFWMRRDALRFPQMTYFSALCAHGLVISICGSLVLGVVAYVFLRVVQPDYIADNIRVSQQVLNDYDATVGLQFKQLVDQARSEGKLSAASAAFGMIWYFTFLGAIGSLVCSAIIKLFNRKPRI